MSELAPRPVSWSRTELGELMLPHQANILGKVFGGTILAMVDKAAATAAIRHAGRVCVTAQVDRVTFDSPIEIGEVVRVVAEVTAVGRSSLEVEVAVYALEPRTGHERLTNTSLVTMVAIDGDGKPTRVPPLELTGEAERARNAVALARMAERKIRRAQGR
ncbi:MAG: acyl-CoA thioesterase [Planctomycetota bacterium]